MSAPSFSSFPPSFSSFPNLESGPSNGESDRERGRGKGSEREWDKERKPKHKHRDREGKGKSERRHRSPSTEGHTRAHNPGVDLPKHDEAYRLYITDTKGDPLTLQYGGLYTGDVPRYRLYRGGRQILGLSKSWTVFRRSGNGIEVGFRGTSKLVGLSDSSTRSLLALPPTKKLLPSTTSSSKYEEVDGVIRLPTRRGRKQPEDSYRAITISRDADLDSDSDSTASSAVGEDSEDEGSVGSPTLNTLQLTIKNLEQELTEKPAAIDKWLTLLNHTLSTIPITSRNATKARSEITVAVLSRALSADPHNMTSKLLRLRYIKAGEEIWQEAKLTAEWEEALKVGGVEIWIEWLEWRIRNCKKGMDGLVEDVSRIYATLRNDNTEAAELMRLRVFWRMTIVYKNAGFTEKAMAMFQAQVELTFKVPQRLLNAPLEARLAELEEFWDSEAPRIGEEGAHGWNRWHGSGKPSATPLSATLTRGDGKQVTQLDPYRQWAFCETQQDQSSLFPAKSFDDETEADPYSTVLFSDIRAFLFEARFPSTWSTLRLAWLSFLGLHVPGFVASLTDHDLNWDDRWNMGYLTNQPHLDIIFPTDANRKALTTESSAGVLVGREREYANSFGIPVRVWGNGVVGCLDAAVNGSRELRSWWTQEDVAGVDVLVVRRVFAQLRTGSRDVGWDELALAFESVVNLKNSLKLSRSLVSTAQDSLLHWAAHAQLERMRGRLDDARKVYQTVLIASKPAQTTTGLPILWWDWAELEWMAGNDEQAINIVLRSIGLESASSGAVVLRAKRGLEDSAEALKPFIYDEVKAKEREAWIKLRALLEIITGKDVASMLQVFDTYIQSRDCPDVANESILTASLVLLYRYGFILKNPVPPTIIRERASEALELYPSNSVILGIFLESEKGQGVWGRVRRMLSDADMNVGKVKDVARRVEEVWVAGWEKGRWGSEIERTRSGLAGAVESERTRASPVIWRIYLEFEIRTGDLHKAKRILYRAIGECPLYKGLYMLAFGVLRSAFAAHELNSLADLMAERGLRLRKGLDEVLEESDIEGAEEQAWDSEEEESELSEIEQRADELRRLMPY
ncbi:DUF1740-domain-containing protein [Macrolepiota fuliginosa MF-IS2]|uniref:DUF1740-domain-containing protein n=1 Tax=Macrolepiota fuliginosa MF-IS2 TaxID=1400762 RepID=A0A9P6C7P9_9AGAR|nr:DUF1740-domain-containing protein [Macrolepiota fuliginosa MF-IS2]